MQKFTRPLTREVELGGNRLAFTLSDQGISVRPVGSRKPPVEISWGAVLCHMTGRGVAAGQAPSNDDLAHAFEALKKGGEGSRAAAPATHAEHTEAAQPSHAHTGAHGHEAGGPPMHAHNEPHGHTDHHQTQATPGAQHSSAPHTGS